MRKIHAFVLHAVLFVFCFSHSPASGGFFIGSAHAAPVAREEAAILVEQAQRLIDDYRARKENLEEAGRLLNRALGLDPDYAPIYVQAARFTHRGGYFGSLWRIHEFFTLDANERAVALANKAIRLDPAEADAYVVMANLSRKQDDYPSMLAHLEKARALHSKNPFLFYQFGAYYEDHSDYARAEEFYRHVLGLGWESSSQHRNAYIQSAIRLQRIAGRMGNTEALFDYAKIASTVAGPRDADALGEIGYVLAFYGHFDEGAEYGRKAMGARDCCMARMAMGISLYGKWAREAAAGRPQQGEDFFREASRLYNPRHAVEDFRRSPVNGNLAEILERRLQEMHAASHHGKRH